MERSGRWAGLLALGATLPLAACYIHTYATLLDPAQRRAPTCAAAVSVFADSTEVGRPYLPIAQVRIWYPADMVPTPADEQMAQREKAASLGANGLILGHPREARQFDRGRTLAVFIPEDSARAAALCGRGP